MMFDDKKKIASLIISKVGKEDTEEAKMNDGAYSESEGAQAACVNEMMSAIESKNSKQFMMGLKKFLSLHLADKETEEEEGKSEYESMS